MSRDNELADNYAEISRKMNKEVAGNWYLMENEWHLKCVILDKDELSVFEEEGWKITPVSLFREG